MNNPTNKMNTPQQKKFTIWSAFVGKVHLHSLDAAIPGTYELISDFTDKNNVTCMRVVTYDARAYNADQIDALVWSSTFTDVLVPFVVDVNTCWKNHNIIVRNGRTPCADSSEMLKAVRYSDVVDCHFFACGFVKYMQQVVFINHMGNSSTLHVIYGVKNCSNAAYYGGGIVLIGAGADQDYPFGTVDIIGHELGHGLQPNLASVPNTGEYGAISEHCADFIAISFKHFMWTYNSYLPPFDWLIGENRAHFSHIRNMSNPWQQRQAKEYLGVYWVDTLSERDKGGIHSNCSVGNYCFYLFSKKTDIQLATQVFLNCMYRGPTNYSLYTDYLLFYAADIHKGSEMMECLHICNLIDRTPYNPIYTCTIM
jgi:hypothetical protein